MEWKSKTQNVENVCRNRNYSFFSGIRWLLKIFVISLALSMSHICYVQEKIPRSPDDDINSCLKTMRQTWYLTAFVVLVF